ncbi:hypothetical protein OG963_00295 [Streptomyces sp. NBC_01707]|uniref:hypothetical protein n=1 Tax=Streptomyces sp. NBC_01707 TaxID=2975914 RepID=UPI00352FE0EB
MHDDAGGRRPKGDPLTVILLARRLPWLMLLYPLTRRRVRAQAQVDPGLGETVDDLVRGLLEERLHLGADRPVPQESEADTAPLAHGEELSLAGGR